MAVLAMVINQPSSGSREMFDRLVVTPREAARLLSISPRKLWDLTASTEIGHIRIGRCVRYSIAELEQWIKEKGDITNAKSG